MLRHSLIYALITKICILMFLISNSGSAPAKSDRDLIGNYVTSNEIQTPKQTREERKYFKKRHRRLKRWGIDVDVSYFLIGQDVVAYNMINEHTCA